MNKQLTEKMAALWKKAETMKTAQLYAKSTRNPDAAIRATFSADRNVAGTFAWAICRTIEMGHGADFSDAECDKISAALDGGKK